MNRKTRNGCHVESVYTLQIAVLTDDAVKFNNYKLISTCLNKSNYLNTNFTYATSCFNYLSKTESYISKLA